jgi:hypothetical protein
MMRIFASGIVACLALYIMDMAFAEGRHFLVLRGVARHLAGGLGFNF